jgi:hypothetical protein
MNPPDDVNTLRIAFGFVLVASIVSRPDFQRAFVILTTSAAGGVPGATVTVAVRVTPNQRAVMVTVRAEPTADALRLSAPEDLFAETRFPTAPEPRPGRCY